MSRQRFIHPSIWRSPEFRKLSSNGKLLFIGCFSTADDEGRRSADPILLRNDFWPDGGIKVAHVSELLENLEAMSLIRRYGEAKRWLELASWGKFQNPKYKKASTIPPFSGPNPGQTRAESGPSPGQIGPKSSMGSSCGCGSNCDSDRGTTTTPPGAVPVTPAKVESPNNNGRPMADGDIPLAPVFKLLCRGSGVPLGVVACEIAAGRELSWVLAWLMVTEGDVLKGRAKGGAQIKSPAAWFRALCASGKAPPDRYLADAKRKLTQQGERAVPAEIRDMMKEVAAAWELAHKVRCLKCRCFYWTDEEHVCAKEPAHA